MGSLISLYGNQKAISQLLNALFKKFLMLFIETW